MDNETKYGFYSIKCAEMYGSIVYLNPEGDKVLICFVSNDKTGSSFLWPDKVYCGEVTAYVGKIEVPINGYQKPIFENCAMCYAKYQVSRTSSRYDDISIMDLYYSSRKINNEVF